ncbi:MAG: DUF4129 domain-containing protein [Actinomycetota bacterium]|nr:DUF4129 domain-containing protein [Actinomycetota bacterium]
MLVRVAADLPAPTNNPARVKDLTGQILRRPEFQPPRRTLLQAAWHWLATQFEKLLSRLFGGGAIGSRWGALIVVAVVAALVIGLVVLTVARRGWKGGEHRPSPVVLRGHGPSRSSAEWRAEAALHEAAGRWRDALRCRYRALVAELAGRGLVTEVPGRTSGEYRRDVSAVVPAAGPAFDRATDLFERSWYGDRPTNSEDQETFDELARRVLIPVGGGTTSWDVAGADAARGGR